MTPYSIVLADDYQLVRECIREMINATQGLQVVGEAGDGLTLLKLLKQVNPDLIILDILMPGMRGIEAAREIRARYPGVRILFLSMYKSEEFLAQALAAGASGYLLKEDSSMELLQAIEAIRKGRSYLSARLAMNTPTNIIDILRGKHIVSTDPLTPRERQVLKLIAEGRTDRQIGELLFISMSTAQRHRHNIRTKLNLRSTADLVKYAIAKGYTADPS
jgi:DNA-binding NarL/FixJ family response regulator